MVMDFFTSPKDLQGWVKSHESADEAAKELIGIIGDEEQQDVVDTCRAIFEQQDNNASEVLFEVLARHNLTQIKEGKMNDKMIKEADSGIQRGQAPLYQSMPLRVCPKLPYSAGKRVISTWNCREHCLDSICLDDDPLRVYCAEALWRRHVMDKFSREFKDKEGKWVGGYINQRFQVFHDDGGNQMELANEERTRKPRPHQYSTERRLEEGRGEETYDLTASSNKMVKVASKADTSDEDEKIHQIFSDIIDMTEAGISDEDVIYRVAEHYEQTIHAVAQLHKVAMKQLNRHSGVVYAQDNSKMQKTAQAVLPEKSTLVTKREIAVTSLADGQQKTLKMETPVVMVSSSDKDSVFEIVDGPDAGQQFNVNGNMDINDCFGVLEDAAQGMIQDAAEELGLNEEQVPLETEDFPIMEVQ
jgi:hypothetical protein